MKLLHIHASPKGEASSSLRLARVFLEEVMTHAPDTEVCELNLFSMPLPEFGEDAAQAKFAPISERFQPSWSRIDDCEFGSERGKTAGAI